MFDSLSVRSFRLEGEPKEKPERETDIKDVSEDYFRTAGTPVLRGRGFTRSEAMDVRSGVAIVNETFARMNFPQATPIGHAIEFGSTEKPDRKLDCRVVRTRTKSDWRRPPGRRSSCPRAISEQWR